MGFLHIKAAAAATTTAASWDALATALAGSDDGTLGQSTATGRYGVLYDPGDGAGVLLPPGLYDRANGRVSNATGDAYFTLADALAAVTGRGWTTATTGNGVASKSADAAMLIDSGANGAGADDAYVLFTPTSWPSLSVVAMRITAIEGTVAGNNNLLGYTGSEKVRASFTNGSAGVLSQLDGTSPDTDLRGARTVTPTCWVFVTIEDTPTSRLCRFWDADNTDGDEVVIEYDDIPNVVDTGALYLAFCQNTTGVEHSIQISDAHWIELAA